MCHPRHSSQKTLSKAAVSASLRSLVAAIWRQFFVISPANALRNVVRVRIPPASPASCCNRRPNRFATSTCECAMVEQSAVGLRGVRRRRGKIRNEGAEDRGTRRLQREVCRPPQAWRRLHLLRLHAGSQL